MEYVSEKIKKEELDLLKSIYKIPASVWNIKKEKNSMMYSYRSHLNNKQITITFNNFLKEYSIIIGGRDEKVCVGELFEYTFETGGHSIYKRHQQELKKIFDKANEPLREKTENEIISKIKNIKNKILKWK